jgi:hypothetical protein
VHLAPASIHAAIGHAFAQALHPSFVVSGVALLSVAVLSALAMSGLASAPAAGRLSEPETIAAKIPVAGTEIS